MHCPECGTQVHEEDNFCRKCGRNLRSIPSSAGDTVGGDKVGGHRVGEDYIDVGSIADSKNVAVGESNTVQDIQRQNIEAQRPAGKEVTILWGAFRYSTFISIAGISFFGLLIALVSWVTWGSNSVFKQISTGLATIEARQSESAIAVATIEARQSEAVKLMEAANSALESPLAHKPLLLSLESSTSLRALEQASEQLQIAIDHRQFLQDSLSNGEFSDAQKHAEHVINIIVGEDSPLFGDLDQSGQVQNPGDAVGVTSYLDEAKSLATRELEFFNALESIGEGRGTQLVESSQRRMEVIIESFENAQILTEEAIEKALIILAADSVEEALPAADELKLALEKAEEEIANAMDPTR